MEEVFGYRVFPCIFIIVGSIVAVDYLFKAAYNPNGESSKDEGSTSPIRQKEQMTLVAGAVCRSGLFPISSFAPLVVACIIVIAELAADD